MAFIKPPGGPFSMYPQIDRTLCIIDGQKLTLKINANDELICLDQNSLPYSFPGELWITSQINEDTLTDFNVMTKRDKFQHTVQRHTLKADQNAMNVSISNEDDVLFLVVARGNLIINQTTITKGDAIRLNRNTQAIQIASLTDNSVIYLVRIFKVSYAEN